MTEQIYQSIYGMIQNHGQPARFRVEDVFTRAIWLQIGDGLTRRKFCERFKADVKAERFPGVVRLRNADGTLAIAPGREALYKYEAP